MSPVVSRALEVGAVFLRLGCLSFGGPIAHLGYFHAELVERRRWLDAARYGDLVALCQFLPGPASSQVVFAIGFHRAGLLGAVLASLAFTLPSALLMLAVAIGFSRFAPAQLTFLPGLLLAAVAVVAQAVWSMGRKLCPDTSRRVLALVAAAALLAVPGALTQLAVITGGALFGWWRWRRTVSVPAPASETSSGSHRAAAFALALFVLLLAILPALATVTESRLLAELDAFYRAGSLVFGGGHVVLPLLRAELVPRGWLADEQFLAGYAAAQAVPGPLFTFSAWLGAAMHPGPRAWLNGLWCLGAIFLPAWLLVGGALPFWERLRSVRGAQAALAGANATVVGVLLAALYRPLATEALRGPLDGLLVVLAFVALEVRKVPAWAVVGALAALSWARALA